MSFGIHGDYERVNESHYPGRVREAALNQERADDQDRLAELEDFVRRHRRNPPQPPPQQKEPKQDQQDSLDLHPREQKPPAKKEPPKKEPSEKPPVPMHRDEGGHLDITI